MERTRERKNATRVRRCGNISVSALLGLNEMKGDKAPVGLYHNELIPYTSVTFSIKKGDRLFATTDGLPDQFGGPKGKKLMYKAFEALLIANQTNYLSGLKQAMTSSFERYR